MTHRRLLRAAAPGALLLAVVLTGCGSSESSASAPTEPSTPDPTGFADGSSEEIARAGLADMAKVKVSRVTGTLMLEGKKTTIDSRNDAAGRCAGTMTTKDGTATFVSTSTASYLKADRKFWKSQVGNDAESVISLLGTQWAKLAPSKEFDALCTLPRTLIQGTVGKKLAGLDVGEVSTVDGAQVVAISDDTGYTMLIDVDSPHYIRKLVTKETGSPDVITFSQFGKTTPVHVPAAGEFVDLR